MFNDDDLKKLIHKTLYSFADLNSQIPDVDQMAKHFYSSLNLSDFDSFQHKFFTHLENTDLLTKAFYTNIIEEINYLIKQLEIINKTIILASWTQGNLSLQTKKAQVFQSYIDPIYLANPSIYASLDKLALLPSVIIDLEKQASDSIWIIDDRINNILNAHKLLSQYGNSVQFIHKIRSDKIITHRVNSQLNNNLHEVTQWHELYELIKEKSGQKIAIVLDKDGVIYNTTMYRKLLESSLLELLKGEIRITNSN